MCRALFDRPVLHGVGDDARGLVIQTLSGLDRALYLSVGLFGQPLFHNGVAKHIGSKNFGNISHTDLSFSMALLYYVLPLKSSGSTASFMLDEKKGYKVY